MAEITKSADGEKIIIECECGKIYKLTLDENNNLKVKESFIKPKKEENETTDKQSGSADGNSGSSAVGNTGTGSGTTKEEVHKKESEGFSRFFGG